MRRAPFISGLMLVSVLTGCLSYGPDSYGPDIELVRAARAPAREKTPPVTPVPVAGPVAGNPPELAAVVPTEKPALVPARPPVASGESVKPAPPDESGVSLADHPPDDKPAPKRRSRPVALGAESFSTVTLTNQIPPDWLRPPTNYFRLGPGDSIEVENLGQGGTRGTSLVGPDGKIYYSLLPGVSVWGLTLTETKERLENELSRFSRVKPELGVTLRGVGSKRLWILGSVQAPGVYPLAAPLTLLDAVSLAGGVTVVPGSLSGMPDLQNSFLMRNGRMLRLDLHRLISLGDLSQNIYLESDDFLYLRSTTTRLVYVLGAVAAPNLVPYSDGMSVLSAIASVGGPIDYARISQVAIVRGSLAAPRIALVDYKAISRGKAADVRIEQGDIVYVPFAPYRRLAMLAEEMIGTIVRTTAINEGYRAVNPNAVPVGGSVPFGGSSAR